ncbi:hypothetical protein CP973_21550 [Streptomyces albofaciens JCM 4342]|uniref:hypothetical protein n=1 Tax=Streptomyces albofaciens TaxID=66866 RepID=UPI00123B1DD2|nr:hypothetical protein [Streptomyces albofaciens]KAA6212068.1 hypothetical protein CP973_21550 [Streptomyces albofaciens JCM 4342]
MSALLRHRRTALRTLAACAAVTATVLGPAAAAFADSPARAAGPTPADIARCTVTEKVDSILPIEGAYVEIVNRPIPKYGPEGPQAVLKDKNGNVLGGVTYNHPVNEEAGLKLTELDSGRAQLWQRRPAGGVAFLHTHDFPALPKGCPVRWETEGGGTYVRTVKLADGGSIAKIYRMGPDHYRAEGFFQGESFGSIKATPATPYVAGNLNGMITALSSKGEVASWIAKARPTGPHNETLADGKTVVRVIELGDQRYRAVLADKGGRTLGMMEVDGDARFRAAIKVGSLWAVLETDGSVTSYVAR